MARSGEVGIYTPSSSLGFSLPLHYCTPKLHFHSPNSFPSTLITNSSYGLSVRAFEV
jgi:hypothetical protein